MVQGLMAGCRSLSAISCCGQIHPEVLAPLGLRRSPSVARLHPLLRRVAVTEGRMVLAAFTRGLLAARTGRPEVGAAAVDGKTLRVGWESAERLHGLHVLLRPVPWASITWPSARRSSWQVRRRPSPAAARCARGMCRRR